MGRQGRARSIRQLSCFNDFFNGFINFLFKDLCHKHKGYFKIFVLCFSYIEILRGYCGFVAGLSWAHVVLAVIAYVFILVSGFGMTVIQGADT